MYKHHKDLDRELARLADQAAAEQAHLQLTDTLDMASSTSQDLKAESDDKAARQGLVGDTRINSSASGIASNDGPMTAQETRVKRMRARFLGMKDLIEDEVDAQSMAGVASTAMGSKYPTLAKDGGEEDTFTSVAG